jgi:hypothetical protein
MTPLGATHSCANTAIDQLAHAFWWMIEAGDIPPRRLLVLLMGTSRSAPFRFKPPSFLEGSKRSLGDLRELQFEVIVEPGTLFETSFEVGRTYNRRNDIHDEFGGQQQGGISTPDGSPFIFLFTGEMGEQYGYDDGWSEGVFLYVGEGQRRDMKFVRGNKAIRDHAVNGKELLLFEALKRKGDHRYAGKFDCAGWHMRDGRDADRATRQVIVFELVPSDDTANGSDESAEELDSPLSTLGLVP